MPIVFVHGVNNRTGDGYAENLTARDAYLKRIVAPVLIPGAGDNLKIFNPYWGDHGVSFSWDMASLPDPRDKFESFGASDQAYVRTVYAADEILDGSTRDTDNLVTIARKNLPRAVEFLFAAQLAGVKDEQDAERYVDAYLKTMDYVRNAPPAELTWLAESDLTPESFVSKLGAAVIKLKGESFGSGLSWLERFEEGLSRAVGAIPDAANGLLLGKSRKGANATATRFVGDAFVYLIQRERQGVDAPIIAQVVASLDKADAIRKSSVTGDNKLVVMSHSFGGEIMYDILTKYRPNLVVDCWVTIGSQVGLFEEMKLFKSSDRTLPKPQNNKEASKETVPAWPNIKRWLNVFDLNDVFSYRAEPIFSGVKDYQYDTGYTTLSAHGGYFTRATFYERLGVRLAEGAHD